MSASERTTALAWADEIDAERRACTRGATWAQLDAAIRSELTHDAGCLADIGTECLMHQALQPTRPAALDEAPAAPHPPQASDDDGMPGPAWLLAAVALIAASAAASALWPWGWALPLP